MRYSKVLLITAALVSTALFGAQAFAVTFNINFDSSFDTQEKRDALKYAADILGSLLVDSYPGETINIEASFDTTLPANALSSTSPISAEYDRTLNHNLGPFFGSDYYFYPTALANHLAGQDRDPTMSEISMRFNPNPTSLIGATPWYFGTDGVTPENHFDFVTNVLHELVHGIGMVSGMNGNGSFDFVIPNGPFAGIHTGYIYDAFVFDATTLQPLVPLNPTDRAWLLAKGDLRFSGNSATEANNGVYPSLFVPDPFREGSSVIHLDPIVHPDDLMRPNLGLEISNHSLSAINIGILKGVGWTMRQTGPKPVPVPAIILLLME